jgi:hypothetical protein
MHHKSREAAIKKYSTVESESIDALAGLIKEENPELTFGNVIEILNEIKTLKEPTAARSVVDPQKATYGTIVNGPISPLMGEYDKWVGDLQVVKFRKIPGTNQREAVHVFFRITAQKPNFTNIRITPDRYKIWIETHFTARAQATELLFPAGVKGEYHWKLNDETEKWEWELIPEILETA